MGRGRADGGGVGSTNPAHGASLLFLRPPPFREVRGFFFSAHESRSSGPRACCRNQLQALAPGPWGGSDFALCSGRGSGHREPPELREQRPLCAR